MDYQVTLIPQAMEQIRQTALYIAHTLQEAETAKRWADLLYKEITGLCFMPSRYPLVEEEPWRSKGVHKMPVKNHLVYYFVNEEAKLVYVPAVIYGRRDQLVALADITQD